MYVTVLQVWIWGYGETGSRLQTAFFFFEISALPFSPARFFWSPSYAYLVLPNVPAPRLLGTPCLFGS